MHRYDPPRRILAFGIAALAGFVDAQGFLAADGYFVSFMSGNTTRMGVDIATGASQAVIPAALIIGFIAGVTGGALLADWAGSFRKTAVLSLSALLLTGAAIARMMGHDIPFLAACVLAMGVLNNAFRQNGEVAVGVTYMTGALVRFAQGLAARLAGRRHEGWLANGWLWASLAAGALLGAMAHTRTPNLSSWIALAIALALLLMAGTIERRSARPG